MSEDDFDPAEQHIEEYEEELPKPEVSLAGHMKRPRGLYTMRCALERWLTKRGIGTPALADRIHAEVVGDMARRGIKGAPKPGRNE